MKNDQDDHMIVCIFFAKLINAQYFSFLHTQHTTQKLLKQMFKKIRYFYSCLLNFSSIDGRVAQKNMLDKLLLLPLTFISFLHVFLHPGMVMMMNVVM